VVSEDNFRFADNTSTVRSNHLKNWVSIEDLQGYALLQELRSDKAATFKESLEGLRHPVISMGRPGLLGKIWQIVSPVVRFHPHGVYNVGQIIFRICQDKGRMPYFVGSAGAHW
jgi:hypothetical protein